MIVDFKSEVKSKLELGEKIQKSFEARNYEMIEQSPNIAVIPGANLVNGDRSYKYSFVITNKQVFIGNVNPFNQIIASNVYPRDDVDAVDLNSIDKKKGFQFVYIAYTIGFAGFPLILCSTINANLKSTFLSDYIFFVYILVFVLFFYLFKFLAKLLKRFSSPNELGIEISLNTTKKISVLLDNIKNLKYFKKTSI